ncbi:hypothetical protein [Demequina litorisediminis]|uniref:Uncharacterized protein n=1 Tax=Demequina litorisediminis TaxID=1849022 RepID=A0ABQ6II58_9MICO|nr:hypothetical protein [Demequina litorisediminis]GMA36841.1 hypothetical protein GCM10025876_30450 [Demequina litorisediminis]
MQRILDALGPLVEPLYGSIADAESVLDVKVPELSETLATGPSRTHAVRGLVAYQLERRDIDPWSVTVTHNSGITLRHDGLVMRVLHGSSGGAIPSPGRNLARQNFYLNPTLDDEMLPPSDNLLALWSLDHRSEVEIRIVRPTGTWRHGEAGKADLDFILPGPRQGSRAWRSLARTRTS